MTIAFVDSASATAVIGDPKTISPQLSNLTANKCLIVLALSGREDIIAGWNFGTPTWNGANMTLAGVITDFALGGFGSARTAIYYLAIGDVVNLTASAVETLVSTSGFEALQGTVIAYSGVNQTTPLNDVNSSGFTSATSSISLSVNSDTTDRVVGVVCFGQTTASGALPTSGQTKRTGISTTTSSPMAHVVGEEDADASSTAGNWGSFNSSFAYSMASFAEAPSVAPVITNVNGGSTAVSNETDLTLNGTDLAPAGTTRLYYADSSVFATATLQGQSISSVVSNSLNWDAIDLGSIGVGANFLFVATDVGGANEEVSAAFAITVSQAPPVIDDVNGGSTAETTETNLTVNGAELNPPGITTLYYADGSDFGTAVTKEQVISAITDTSLNWDAIDVSVIGIGANFLFVVTDDGGANEKVSDAFAFTITEPVPVGHVRFGGCRGSANGVVPSIFDHAIINVGGFAEVYRTGTPATDFELRTHESGDASVSIVQNANDLDFTVPTTAPASEVFQEDSTSTRLSDTTVLTTWVTLAGDAKVLSGETWKINMCLLVCNPVGDTDNSEMIWQIETSAGVFTEFDRYSNHAGLTIVGDERSMPIARTKKLVAEMDAPRMRIQVHRVTAGLSVLWEHPRWGGSRISVAP